MFKYTYHIAPTRKPGVVTLSPTKETWAKAFAPSLIIFGGLWVAGTAMQYKERRDLKKNSASRKK